MTFLSARWNDLILANYIVEPEVLEPFVPHGTRLDEFDGQLFVSLVAFMFNDTRILGVPIPFHGSFEEVNLRFYVVPLDAPEERSVTFIKEIVPKSIIPWVSNTLFKEHYQSLPMSHEISPTQVSYAWGRNLESSISISLPPETTIPEQGSVEEFISEHYWGFTQNGNQTIKYRVTHPQWKVSRIEHCDLRVDFENNYGERFAFLNDQSPDNVIYANGSEVTVSFPSRLAIDSSTT